MIKQPLAKLSICSWPKCDKESIEMCKMQCKFLSRGRVYDFMLDHASVDFQHILTTDGCSTLLLSR